MYRDKFHIKYCPKTVSTKNSNHLKNNISNERPCSSGNTNTSTSSNTSTSKIILALPSVVIITVVVTVTVK